MSTIFVVSHRNSGVLAAFEAQHMLANWLADEPDLDDLFGERMAANATSGVTRVDLPAIRAQEIERRKTRAAYRKVNPGWPTSEGTADTPERQNPGTTAAAGLGRCNARGTARSCRADARGVTHVR